jgi:hypothetical protein
MVLKFHMKICVYALASCHYGRHGEIPWRHRKWARLRKHARCPVEVKSPELNHSLVPRDQNRTKMQSHTWRYFTKRSHNTIYHWKRVPRVSSTEPRFPDSSGCSPALPSLQRLQWLDLLGYHTSRGTSPMRPCIYIYIYFLWFIILFVNIDVSRYILMINISIFTKNNMGQREYIFPLPSCVQ